MWTKPTYAESIHREVITAARGGTEVAQSVQNQKEEGLRQSPEEHQYLKDEQKTQIEKKQPKR